MTKTESGISSIVTVKLGGSLITDKTGDTALRGAVLERLAEELASAYPRVLTRKKGLILGHGSGSFGHVAARKTGYDNASFDDRTPEAGATIQAAAFELNRHVMSALERAGLPAIAYPPSSFLVASAGALDLSAPSALAPLEQALHQGRVPVVFGDVIQDSTRVFTIASTESVLRQIAQSLASRLPVSEALWLGETDGIHDLEGHTLPLLDRQHLDLARRAVAGARGSDVTGGMRHRLVAVLELSRLGATSKILNGLEAGTLARALDGEDVGGTVVPSFIDTDSEAVNDG